MVFTTNQEVDHDSCFRAYIQRTLELADEMKSLADEGQADARDDSFAVLCCVLRDCAYTVTSRAEFEVQRHHRALDKT